MADKEKKETDDIDLEFDEALRSLREFLNANKALDATKKEAVPVATPETPPAEPTEEIVARKADVLIELSREQAKDAVLESVVQGTETGGSDEAMRIRDCEDKRQEIAQAIAEAASAIKNGNPASIELAQKAVAGDSIGERNFKKIIEINSGNPYASAGWNLETYFANGDGRGVIVSATLELDGKPSTIKATIIDDKGQRVVTKLLRYVPNKRIKDKLELTMTSFPSGHIKLAEEALESWIQTIPQEEWEQYIKHTK